MSNSFCFGCMTENSDETSCEKCGYALQQEAVSPLYLPAGTVLKEQYLIGRVLGHGGFGITYLAFDLKLKVKLAIKEYLPREHAARDNNHATVAVHTDCDQQEFSYGLKKFMEEAQNVARFQNHPGIVGVLNYFEANSTGYMVMPYVEGVTLKEYLSQQPEKRISCDKALGIFMPLLDALREVHNAGLLHRDISPDNIYLTYTGQIKLLDFGSARFSMGEHSKSLSIVLKPGYSPKEQYSAKGKQGPWTDIYATAATLYRSLTGVVPDEALDRAEEDELRKPNEFGIEISKTIEQTLLTAMSVSISDRFQTIEAFQQELKLSKDKINDVQINSICDEEDIMSEIFKGDVTKKVGKHWSADKTLIIILSFIPVLVFIGFV